MADIEGYGDEDGQDPVERLLADIRELSPAGIERIAAGWDMLSESGGMAELERSRTSAVRLLEEGPRTGDWEDLRRSIAELTGGENCLTAWRAGDADVAHRAAQAALTAGLALRARKEGLPRADYEALVEPMAAALPWLISRM